MKKFIMGLIVGIIIATTLSAGATSNIRIFVNDKEINAEKAIISEGVTLVPLRTISEALNASVKWEEETRSIYISSAVEKTETRPKLTLRDITNRFLPAVVLIETQGVVLGSGFFATPDKVITNVHVIEEYSNNLVVATRNGRKLKAQVLKSEKDWDLALLKVQGDFPYIGDISTTYAPGDKVYSFPYKLPVAQGELGITLENPLVRTMHYRAPVSLGSSGSPLLNEYGELIGVTFSGFDNTAFAIAAEYVQKILESN